MAQEIKDFISKNREAVAVFVIMLLALNFRVLLLGLHRLHMDECLYASYAIRMLNHGDLTLNGGLIVDKPPAFFYFLALSFLINGISENAARLPNIIFSLVTMFYIFKLAKKMYPKDTVTPFAAIFFLAFSVFYTLFSVTAFQDISMLAFMLISFYYVKEEKYFLSAFFYSFSIACKPMTLFLLPIFVYISIMQAGRKITLKIFMEYIKGAAVVFVPMVIWSALLANPRWGVFTFFITQQPDVMSVSENTAGRLMQWIKDSGYVLNNFVWLAMAPAGMVISLAVSAVKKDRDSLKNDIFLLLSFIFIYFLLSFVKFRFFDRYLLVVVPFACLMLARGVSLIHSVTGKKTFAVIAMVMAFVYIFPMRNLDKSDFQTGALFRDSDGFEKVADFVRGKPETTLIYFGHTISWYGYFYLPDEKFHSVKTAFSINQLREFLEAGKESTYVVVNARHRNPEEIKAMQEWLRIVFTSGSEESLGEKYIILERIPGK